MHLVRYDSWQMAVLGAESFLATEDMHDFYDNNIRSALSEADLSFKPDAGAESSLVRRVSSFHGGLQDTAFSAEAEDANAAQLAVADQLADSLLRTDLREEPVEPPTASILHPLDKQPGPLCSNTDISALCVPAGPSSAAARSQPVAGMIPVTQPADMDCRNHSHTSRVVTTTHALSVPAASPPRQLAEHSPFNWSGLPSHAASAPAQHVRHVAATASSYPSGLQQPASSHAESEDGDEDEGCSRPAPSAATMPRIKLPPTAAMRMHALRAQRKPRIPGQSGTSSTAKIHASGLGSKGVTKPITTPRTTLPIPTAAAVPAGPRRGSGKVVCRNCAASSTPQWRCGPEGPRTLCNACGVRYKKGMPLAYMEAKMMLAADGNSQGL